MEIIHAAYRTHSQNAAFLIRNDEFVKYLPPEMMGAFVDAHPLNKAHLKVFNLFYRIFVVFLHFFFFLLHVICIAGTTKGLHAQFHNFRIFTCSGTI